MNSSRLPGKILLPIAGRPMLNWVVARAQGAGRVDQVVVATTTSPADDAVAAHCAAHGIAVSRGPEQDVLDRYLQAARAWEAAIVVRLTADCPLLDPVLIDATIAALLGAPPAPDQRREVLGGPGTTSPPPTGPFPFDFAANRLPPPWARRYPIGLDVEVASRTALERAGREATAPHQREHVMPYLYEPVTPPRFPALLLECQEDWGHLRWTVDTPEDHRLVETLLTRLSDPERAGWRDVLALVQADPSLAQVNAAIHSKDYREVDRRRGQ
jgi:spore coat polysaccharide biosynthesis protein SpsF